MGDTPIISVIIPVRNGAEYLLECLLSIESQELDGFEIETIVVNDHSEDGTQVISEKWCSHQSKARTVVNSGRGIIEALQTGIDLSSGAFISRMDADDLMPSEKMKNLFRPMRSDSCQLSTGKVEYFASGKELNEGYVKYSSWLNNLIDSGNPYSGIYRECPIASPNWIIRRSVFANHGGLRGLQYPEDYELVFRWYEKSVEVTCVDQVTHLWRDHEMRTSRNSELYKDNRFIKTKVRGFLRTDGKGISSIRLLGAGKKGKAIARELIENNVDFEWYSGNTSKLGLDIYGRTLLSDKELTTGETSKIIVGISSPGDLVDVQQRFSKEGLQEGRDYFMFF